MSDRSIKLLYAQTIMMAVFFFICAHLMVMLCNYAQDWGLGQPVLVGITMALLGISYGITHLLMRNDPLVKFERRLRNQIKELDGLLKQNAVIMHRLNESQHEH